MVVVVVSGYVPWFVLQLSLVTTGRDAMTDADAEARLPVGDDTLSGCRWLHCWKVVTSRQFLSSFQFEALKRPWPLFI